MIYMQSTIELRPEFAVEFNAVMAEIVAIQEAAGWRLVSAFQGFTGRLSAYVDIWSMEDAGHFQRGLFALRGHPEIQRIKDVLARIVISETIVLGAPAAYDHALARD